ncbi:MAG: AAA family ATPase [Deltaproteobacteria bacterium]|nr:AAA family ATPase [Deltaproteobacteria bacterium]
MHLTEIQLFPEKYPTVRHYPFNLKIFHATRHLTFTTPVTFLVGENGAGKSTLLRALCHKCGIHIWEKERGDRMESNPYDELLYRYMDVQWKNGRVYGSFFGSENFRNFTEYVDEWAASDPESLKYFGGKSLVTQSHGQSMMTYFRARYQIKGLYFLDEPETALSPKSQLELVRILKAMGEAGHAQFIVATHSPILLACPGATIFSFDHVPVQPIQYEETEYYKIFKGFLENRENYL